MARQFSDLAARTKAAWSDEAQRVYEIAAAEFAAEMGEQAALGAALAEARRSRELTQPALSAITGIQQAEISRIERGVGNPTAATLTRLANALGRRFALVPAER
ncbi:helix-turn-helix domain-containing protein [Microbacterium sp. MPKO10]|uniref:helix-turn-helix domain-containing protein n=1 Tax=Microbacterium sp. MPKO10 TaxID=2989818 RepID=UPI0022366AD7|nr:helix-turn-helix transcriptional regulator [Microbacterium sp. MPKO10]MCW4458578.1 helix-turn-helix domain-containing protein [Microbacterium sp. MPKO10]